MSNLAGMIFKKLILLERTLAVNFRSAGGGAMASLLVRSYPCDIFIHVLFNSPHPFLVPGSSSFYMGQNFTYNMESLVLALKLV